MEIISSIEDKYVLIEVEGDLDASSAIDLDQEIETSLNKERPRVLVDCGKLEYISSAGLGVFISYLKEFETRNIVLVLFGLSDKVKNVFQILGLDNLVNIASDKDSAIDDSFE